MISKVQNSQKNSYSTTTSTTKTIILPSLKSPIIEKDSIDLSSQNSNIEMSSGSTGSIIPNNYSQYSLSNKIILSILKCIIHLCKLNYEWKDSGYEQSKKGVYINYHQRVNSNPLTEYVNLYLLLITPLLSNLHVRNINSIIF